MRFRANNWFKPSSSSPTDRVKAVPLLQFFVRLCFHLWCLFCPYLFLLSTSFGTMGTWLLTVAFPGYHRIYFWNKSSLVKMYIQSIQQD